jgi:diadenosine tetraphosphate (Ap4A) HIT family hydrolase
VAPLRVAERVADLTPEEIGDLFKLAQKVEQVMEKIHSATSSTIAVQDGPDSGQTIKVSVM